MVGYAAHVDCVRSQARLSPAQQRLWREDTYEHIQELMPLQGRLSLAFLLLPWAQEVPSSNLGAPTIFLNELRMSIFINFTAL
jgi:hypothetical protein